MDEKETAPARQAPDGTGPRMPGPGAATASSRLVSLALAAALFSACARGTMAPTAAAAAGRTGARPPASAAVSSTRSLVHVPAPDYARPAPVAASFYTAWASVGTICRGRRWLVSRLLFV